MLELNSTPVMVELNIAEINEVAGGISAKDIYDHALTTELGNWIGGKVYDWTH